MGADFRHRRNKEMGEEASLELDQGLQSLQGAGDEQQ